MSSVVLTGDTSGAGTITVPAVAGTFTATIGSATGTHYPFTAGTAVASTSGTSIDFTSIPSWVKRITVMFNGVSTSGASNIQVQLGVSGTPQSTLYTSTSFYSGTGSANRTTGFHIVSANATAVLYGAYVINNVTGNTWQSSCLINDYQNTANFLGSGNVPLTGTLNMIRITTVNGTDTFDAGSINILYE